MTLKIFDQHLHSNFSFDSTEPLASYLQKFPHNQIVTTEHLDFHNPISNFHDDVPDYDRYLATQQKLRVDYGQRLYTGIEIGYTADTEPQIQDYLQQHPFDLKLLSVHQNGTFDFMEPVVTQLPATEVIQQYTQLLLTAVESDVPADIFAHFDYGLRQLTITPPQLYTAAGPRWDQIIDVVVDRHLALELNTKSMYRYHNLPLYDSMIDIFIAHGGTRFSIGSDAHNLAYYADHFEAARQLLLAKGVTQVVSFGKREETISLTD